MHKKGFRYIGILLSAVLIFSVCYIPQYSAEPTTPLGENALGSVPDNYIVGSESDGTVADSALVDEITADNCVMLDFTSESTTKETVNKLLVENNEFADDNCNKFEKNVSLTDKGLQLFNYYNFKIIKVVRLPIVF